MISIPTIDEPDPNQCLCALCLGLDPDEPDEEKELAEWLEFEREEARPWTPEEIEQERRAREACGFPLPEFSGYIVSTDEVDGKLQYTVKAHYYSRSQERLGHFPEIPDGLVILGEIALCDYCGHSADYPCGCGGGVTQWVTFGDKSQQSPYCD